MRPWEVRCASELDALRRQKRFRLLRRGRVHGRWMDLDGRRLLQCASNDYLGLSVDPRVRQAAMAAADEYGGGATGSRLISGNHGALTTLEEALAAWHGTEAALVFSSGYATNVAVLSALARPGDEGRIRLSITADHDEADIDFILQVFTAVRNEVPGVAENRATNTTE